MRIQHGRDTRETVALNALKSACTPLRWKSRVTPRCSSIVLLLIVTATVHSLLKRGGREGKRQPVLQSWDLPFPLYAPPSTLFPPFSPLPNPCPKPDAHCHPALLCSVTQVRPCLPWSRSSSRPSPRTARTAAGLILITHSSITRLGYFLHPLLPHMPTPGTRFLLLGARLGLVVVI